MASELTRDDFQTRTWKRLTTLLQERLQELRELNDQASLSADKTALIRGQIKVIKELLDLPQGSSGDANELAVSHLDLPPSDWHN
jgi:hypothetical protein